MPAEPLFHARDLTKVYRMGDVEVVEAGARVVVYPPEGLTDGARVR